MRTFFGEKTGGISEAAAAALRSDLAAAEGERRRLQEEVKSLERQLVAGEKAEGEGPGAAGASDTINPLVIVFSELRRCRNPQFTQLVQKAKNPTHAAAYFPGG